MNMMQKKAENIMETWHGHLMNAKDIPTQDDGGEWGQYAKCSKCGAVENTDQSIQPCPKSSIRIKKGRV